MHGETNAFITFQQNVAAQHASLFWNTHVSQRARSKFKIRGSGRIQIYFEDFKAHTKYKRAGIANLYKKGKRDRV